VHVIRSPRDARTLERLPERVRAEFGPDAVIVGVREVRTGGFHGFFARSYAEVTVDSPRWRDEVRSGDLDVEVGDDEDASPSVSTSGSAFEEVLGDFARSTGAADPDRFARPSAAVRASQVLGGIGDLCAIVGLGIDAMTAARSLAEVAPPATGVFIGGQVAGAGARIDGRREALAARATAVERGGRVVLAWGLGDGRAPLADAVELASLGPDRVVVVVDASRKPDDTKAWVDAVRDTVDVVAVITVQGVHTASPESVRALRLPPLRLQG
jgi:hypothetical protein